MNVVNDSEANIWRNSRRRHHRPPTFKIYEFLMTFKIVENVSSVRVGAADGFIELAKLKKFSLSPTRRLLIGFSLFSYFLWLPWTMEGCLFVYGLLIP